MPTEVKPEAYTSYTIRGLRLGNPRPACAFTSSDPQLALGVAKVLKQYGLKLEIFWCHFQPTAVPGEQGQLTLEEFERQVLEHGANGSQAKA